MSEPEAEAEALARELLTLTTAWLHTDPTVERDPEIDRAFAEATASPLAATKVIEELALLCCHAMGAIGALVDADPEAVLRRFLQEVAAQQLARR